MRKFFYILLCAFFFVSCFSHGNDSRPVADITDTGDTVSDDSDTVTDTGDTVADNGDTVPDNGDTVSDDDDTVSGDVDTVSDDGDNVSDDSDAVHDDSDTVPDDGDTDDDDDTDDDSDYQEEFDDFDGETIQIRIVTGNITSGNDQSYDPGHGIRIFQALKPDIALVQEMNYKNNSASDYKNFAQQIVGTDYYAVEDPSEYNIPNGIVSKYPITKTGSWDDPTISDRALKWAVVDIPGNTDIFAISVHLKHDDGARQKKAALVIVDEITKLKSSNPGKYYYVVGGDFNGPTAVSSDGFGKNNTFYVNGPHPVDEEGNGNTNAGREKQYDFVLADYPLHEFQVPVVYYSSEDSTKTKVYENGLVFDTSVYTQNVLNEYFYPAQTGDSSASQMQHMAVVKDFLIKLP